jgi:hypothetical protein
MGAHCARCNGSHSSPRTAPVRPAHTAGSAPRPGQAALFAPALTMQGRNLHHHLLRSVISAEPGHALCQHSKGCLRWNAACARALQAPVAHRTCSPPFRIRRWNQTPSPGAAGRRIPRTPAASTARTTLHRTPRSGRAPSLEPCGSHAAGDRVQRHCPAGAPSPLHPFPRAADHRTGWHTAPQSRLKNPLAVSRPTGAA